MFNKNLVWSGLVGLAIGLLLVMGVYNLSRINTPTSQLSLLSSTIQPTNLSPQLSLAYAERSSEELSPIEFPEPISPKKIIDEEWKQNIFTPPFIVLPKTDTSPTQPGSTFSPGVIHTSPTDLQTELDLTGIIYQKDKQVAIINNQLVRVGSKIGDKEVVEIKKNGVILSEGKKLYLLKIGKPLMGLPSTGEGSYEKLENLKDISKLINPRLNRHLPLTDSQILSELPEEITQLKKELEDSKNQINMLLNEIGFLQEKINLLQDALKEEQTKREELEKAITSHQTEIAELTKLLQDKVDEIAIYQDKLSQQTEQIKSLQEKLTSQETNITELLQICYETGLVYMDTLKNFPVALRYFQKYLEIARDFPNPPKEPQEVKRLIKELQRLMK